MEFPPVFVVIAHPEASEAASSWRGAATSAASPVNSKSLVVACRHLNPDFEIASLDVCCSPFEQGVDRHSSAAPSLIRLCSHARPIALD